MVYQKSRKRYSRKRTSRKRYSRKRYSRKRTSRKRTSRKRYSHKRKVQEGGSKRSELSRSLLPDDSSSDNQGLSQDEMAGFRATARTNCDDLWRRFQLAEKQEDVIKEVMAFVDSPKNILFQKTLGNFISKLVERIGTEKSCDCVDNIVNKGLLSRKISGRKKYNGVDALNPVPHQVFNIVQYIMNPKKTNTTQRRQICTKLLEIA